ncbi:MAG: AMP-binding protein, partial [Psychrobium sp.]|nr:AMP-binding protein [Psychrobium sp.]
REMRHQFKDSGAKAIVILADLLPKLTEIKNDTDIETVIVTNFDDLLTGNAPQLEQGISFNQAMSIGDKLTLKPRSTLSLDDVCVLQYTGGTTGVSKGACLTHRNILSNASQTLARIVNRCDEGDGVLVCPLPLYHIYAFSVNMVIYFGRGNLNVLIPNPRDIDAFVSAIKPFKITGISGINTLFVGLCHHPEFKKLDFSDLKLSISGGSALTVAAVKVWQEITGCTITEGYGLSETGPVVCMNEPGNEQIGSIGKPLSETEVEIWDTNDQPVAVGQEGQIVVRGPQVMPGYWNMAAETALAMKDGFFKTGDIAVKRENGCFKIVDRLKDMIIVSGFNVYPNEIEEVLASYPNVLEAAVVGEPDERSGEKVCAYITVEDLFNETDLITYCKEQLTGYKVPKKIVVLEALPKSAVGKILRRELRH